MAISSLASGDGLAITKLSIVEQSERDSSSIILLPRSCHPRIDRKLMENDDDGGDG